MDSFSMVSTTGIFKFKINHSKTKDMGIGEYITSPKFQVGQHDWSIKYYPQGDKTDNNGKYVSVFLNLRRESLDVRAAFRFVLLDKQRNVIPTTSKEISDTCRLHEVDWGFSDFFERTKLEETCIKDSYFVLFVQVTLKEGSCTIPHWNTSSVVYRCEGLQKFREEKKCTDVSFDVDGEIIVAHRLILAAHSPVFEVELFGTMAESNRDCIKINEMMPSVFKAMLDFMYSGSLSVHEILLDCEEPMSSTVFLQHLLVAADRYAVEKLKVACEYKLVKIISLETVLSFLEFAEKHNCTELQKYCLRFVVDKKNSVWLMFNEQYIKLMQNYPSLLAELKNLAEK